MIHLVVPTGISHISLRHKKYNRGRAGEKEQRRNEHYRLSLTQVQEGLFRDTLHSLSIWRLTLTCILREISTKPRGMLTHLDWSSLTDPGLNLTPSVLFCCPVSTRPLRHPSPTAFSGFLFPTLLTGVPLPTSGRVEISSSGLCLVSRQKKQKKFVCLAHLLHSVRLPQQLKVV